MNYFIITAAAVFLLLPFPTQAYNLTVPFTPQAPEGNWRQPWQDTCEETSIVMVNNFYQGNTTKKKDKDKAKKEILQILKIKENKWGKSLDESAAKVADIINNFLPWEARVIENPTLDQMKAEIDANRPVILPAYGKALKNPYFRSGGPVYHMLVISGYDEEKQEFIVQEPGTRFGLDFRYSFATIMDAAHDFTTRAKVSTGKKVAIFTSKEITDSAPLDGDNDGLTKAEELKYGSILYLKDSDGDGYADGEEVKNGYSPTKKYQKL